MYAVLKEHSWEVGARNMFHQFPNVCYALSHRLSNILDRVGYSPEDRERKVRTATEEEVFANIQGTLKKWVYRMYMFGSRGEGSTGPGLNSDADYLYQCSMKIKLISDLFDCQAGKIYLYMSHDENTHPGYVKLQPILILPDKTFVTLSYRYGVSVMANTDFHFKDSGYRTGPATHAQSDYLSCDHVMALRCSQWPREGYEWFHRRRLYDWPKTHQIQTAWKYGCFATPVGHSHSSEAHLEWRLSFSIAERDLVRSFENTVMKVYILLKMIKKTFIEPVLGDAFSSYHCKVCMLWMREKTRSELWCAENLLCCLILCIRQLYEWAIAGVCPDYFIVNNNIYDRKLVGMARMKLIQIYEHLLSDDCRFLCRIECCHIGHRLADDLSSFKRYRRELELTTAVINQEQEFDYAISLLSATNCRISVLRDIPQNYQSLTYYLIKFAHVAKHAPYVMQYPLKHIAMIICSQLGFYFASVLKENAGLFSGGNVDYILALTSECLSFSMNIDATSVRLKLCGLGIVLENHDLTEICLQDICENRMRYLFSTSPRDRPLIILYCNYQAFIEKCSNVRYSIQDMLENQVSHSVVYLQSDIYITPIPLRIEMYRSLGTPEGIRDENTHFWYDWAVLDSLMCLYFFQYLNFSRQGKVKHKQVAMDNMIHVIKTEPRIHHKDTALNVLAYCYMQDNQPRNAFIYLRESLKILPHHNAAKFYLGILFQKVNAARTKPSVY